MVRDMPTVVQLNSPTQGWLKIYNYAKLNLTQPHAL